MVLSREELLVDISQRLVVMRKQEASNYVVPDYLAPEWQQQLRDAANAEKDSPSFDAVTAGSVSSSGAVSSSNASSGDDDSRASNGKEMHTSCARDMKQPANEPHPREEESRASSIASKRGIDELATPKSQCIAGFAKSGASVMQHDELPRVCTQSGHDRKGKHTNNTTYSDDNKEGMLDGLKKLGERLRIEEDGDVEPFSSGTLKQDAVKSPRKMSLAGEKRKHGVNDDTIELKGSSVGIEGIACKEPSAAGAEDCNHALAASRDKKKSSYCSANMNSSSRNGKKGSDSTKSAALDTNCSSPADTCGFDTLDAKQAGSKSLKRAEPVNLDGSVRKKAKQTNECPRSDGKDTKWQCGVSKEAKFDKYDEAFAHEKVCTKNINSCVNKTKDSLGEQTTPTSQGDEVKGVSVTQKKSRVYSKKEIKLLDGSSLASASFSSSSASSRAAAVTAAAVASAKAVPSSSQPSDGSASNFTGPSSSQITELWREKICEWCYQVVDHFDFNREVVCVALSYLDRYLATRTVNRRIFQLAAMTALYLAIKLFEPGKLSMSSLIDLSRGYFVAEHIVTMEDSMLQSLHWHVHPPTSFAFCRDLMRLVSGDVAPRARHDANELARFLTELSVCDYWFATKKPSSIALASIINAIELQGARRIDPRYKVEFIHRVVDIGMDIANDDEVIECYERLREMYIAGGYTPTLEEPEDAARVEDSGEIERSESPRVVAV